MTTETITIERIYLSSVEQANDLTAAADKRCTRDDMASVYRDCIIADTMARRTGRERVDFKAVNEAITRRWPKGLQYVKTKAWKMLEAKS